MENRSLQNLKKMAYACRRCGYCREKYSDDAHTRMSSFRVCPVREHSGGFEHHYARGKMQLAQGILEGRISYSQELIDLLYTDPDCKLCSWVCGAEPVLDPPAVWRAMRQDIVEAGLGPPEPLSEIDSRVRERHNVFGGKPELRSRWAKGLDLKPDGEILFFAGCHASYTHPEIARSAVKILREAGIEPAYLGNEEWCCGVVQFHDGSTGLAEKTATRNIEAIRSAGAKTVVTSCAECYKSFKVDYPELTGDLPFEVFHISEIMARLISEGKLTFKEGLAERRVTYHDPCRLGRYCGVYDPPRDVLKAIPGIEIIEMLRHRENAWCCGNGADLVRSMNPGLASAIAADRIGEAVDCGAEAVVTSCPRCFNSLKDAADRVPVYDLTQALARAMDL
ncbi:MAG: (Fe-S)-binding protein [Dehalococcoidia bacterium]